MEKENLLFAYGTLQIVDVQIELFGKELESIGLDSIQGYKVLNDFEIEGEIYPRLVEENKGIVYGHIYNLNQQQWEVTDDYETEAYRKEIISTCNGINVFVYLPNNEIKKMQGIL